MLLRSLFLKSAVHGPRRQLRHQRGFTLLEALVAATIMGVSLSIVLTGIGGVGRGSSRASEHVVARQLAVSVLEQFALNQLDTVNDADNLVYGGVKYGYRLAFDTIEDTDLLPVSALRTGRKLKSVRVEVFWGEQPNLQSYALSTTMFR